MLQIEIRRICRLNFVDNWIIDLLSQISAIMLINLFKMPIMPTTFGPIIDRSEGVARGFILYTQARRVNVYTISDQALDGLCDI